MLTIEQVMAYTGPNAQQLPSFNALAEWVTATEHYLINTTKGGRLHTSRYHGALFLVCGFGGGSLMRTRAFQAAILPVPDAPTLHLHVMGDALAEEDLALGRHACDAFALACAMGIDAPMPRLATALSGWDAWNRWVATVAFAIAAQQFPLVIPSVVRADREERIRAEHLAWDRIQKGTGSEEDHAIHLRAMQRAVTGALL